jgi:hypothetical protein
VVCYSFRLLKRALYINYLLNGCDSYPKCVNDDYHWGCIHEPSGDMDCIGYPFQPDCYCWYITDCSGGCAISEGGCVECTSDSHCTGYDGDYKKVCECPNKPPCSNPGDQYICEPIDSCVTAIDCKEDNSCCGSASAGGPGGGIDEQCVPAGTVQGAWICVAP